MIGEQDNIAIQETYLRHTYLSFLGVIEKPSLQLIDTLLSSLPWGTWQNIKNVGIMVCLKAFVDLEVAVKQHMGWHTRNVDCVMSNHNEEKTKSGETAVYGYDPALFLVLSVSCWCLAKLIFT